jgi:hypothetical protein
MILDAGCRVSSAQAITVDAASDYCIDLTKLKNIAKGEPLCAMIFCIASMATTVSVAFQVITSSAADLSTGKIIICQTRAILAAEMLAGMTPIIIPIPPLTVTGNAQRYIGLYYDITTTGTWTVTAYITPLSMVETNY